MNDVAKRPNNWRVCERKAEMDTVADGNLAALRAAQSQFALNVSVSNHRKFKNSLQNFFEMRMESILGMLTNIAETMKLGYTEEQEELTDGTLKIKRRALTSSDMRSMRSLQAELDEDLAKMLGLPRGEIPYEKLMALGGKMAPAQPQQHVHMHTAWSKPVEASKVDLSKVEIVDE